MTQPKRNLFIFVSTALALGAVAAPSLVHAQTTATLIRVIDTSAYVPPSPDSAGLAYASHSGRLLMSDSEVNEMPIYDGANFFEINLIGNLLATSATVLYSSEPTGVAYNPVNRHVYYTDDDQREVFVVDPGPDLIVNTPDDTISSFDTAAFGAGDPEGIAYNTALNVLHIVDGVDSRVYTVDPGVDGVFNGTPPAGDDVVTSFDTDAFGGANNVFDPEGIAFRPDTGDLLIVGSPPDRVIQTTSAGALVETYDISAAAAVKPAGLTWAPSSIDSTAFVIYVSERGVDNDADPNENDGRIYELSLSPIVPTNQPPQVVAGLDRTVVLPNVAVLDASVSDSDGPGPLTSQWQQVAGPDSAAFDDAGSAFTTASFPVTGTYVLRIIADDGELLASDDVTITVTDSGDAPVVTIVAPADGSQFVVGQPVDFIGTATEEDEGDISGSLQWYSSIDGLIGSGATFTTSSLSVATHLITAAVEDEGLTGTSQIQITINADADGDGVGDLSDNCTQKPNGPLAPDAGGNVQRDTDGDGYGNVCDADLNNDCIVNALDIAALRLVFFSSDPDADFNGDGIVNTIDLGGLKQAFFSPPGPSAFGACQ